VRVEGFAESVQYRMGRLTDLLDGFGDTHRIDDADASERLWRGIRDVAKFGATSGDVWRLSVRPSHAPGIAARLDADGLLFDWGGGLIWARVESGTDLRARIGQIDGHASLVRASPEVAQRLGRFQPQSEPLEAITAGLRARFDPRGIFNPGLMAPPQPVGV
jgi:glycolate oxidase FAD binding subunit